MAEQGEQVLDIRGMSCGNCVSGVTKALEALGGVDSVEVTLDPPRATVKGEDLKRGALLRAVAEAGFSAS